MTAAERARIVCNPVDLAYRYQDVRFSGEVGGLRLGEPSRSVHREAADPTIVRYRGRYFLFASMSWGFWHSPDLVAWEYRPTAKLPPFDYAPDAHEVDGALIISASRKSDSPFFRSEDPLADDFVEVTPGAFPFWDPALFQDPAGELYLYWGCDNATPIRGVRLDPATFEPAGEPVDLIASDVVARGWERPGEDHVPVVPVTEQEKLIASFTGDAPYIEGAWMTHRDGTYYLQYAAPATELNTYADGYCTASDPLGPFEYSPHSPFSAKPGGFITGAGHGSTFQDAYGNWWHAATMRISVNHPFERRIGLFPAGFDEDGVLFCNQSFGDYPRRIPDGPADPWAEPEWMLLAHSAVSASSSEAGHDATLAVDEDIRTWWASADAAPGAWVAVDLGRPKLVHAVQVNVADHDVAASAPLCEEGSDSGHTWRGIHPEHQPVELVVEVSEDGRSWEAIHDSRSSGRDAPHALVLLPAARRVRHVRVTAGRLPFGARFAVSGVRVFGRGDGAAPGATRVRADRTEAWTARLEWDARTGAQGYSIRYGLARDKLYHSWQVGPVCAFELRALNAGVDYWIAVDAFNENGISPGEPVFLPAG